MYVYICIFVMLGRWPMLPEYSLSYMSYVIYVIYVNRVSTYVNNPENMKQCEKKMVEHLFVHMS